MITVPIVRNWHLRTPELYRYMDQKYIDEFFETGNLRLSTFHTFAQHADEQRRDTEEGHNTLVGLGDGHTIMARTQHAHNCLILSTSTVADEGLMEAFETNGYFSIKNSTGFGTAIANRLPGFLEGIEGFCIYAEQRMIKRRLDSFTLDDLKQAPESPSLSLDKIFALTAQIGGADVLFVNHIRFRHQNEYRFVWTVSHSVEEAVFVDS